MHFLLSNLGLFLENLGDVSDEQDEQFHEDIKTVEERYQGRWDIKMMVDYCWNKKRDNPDSEHSTKSQNRKFLPHYRKYFGHSESTETSYLLFETCTYLM